MSIGVIGAGMTGLVAGLRLAEAGHEVHVYERWPGLGGQVATLDIGDGHLLERYYHHLFTSDVHISRLYDDLGMQGAIEWLPSSVAMFADGRSWPFTSPLDLLRFKPMSLPARVRMGAAALLLQKRGKDLSHYEQLTARDWIERSMGPQAWTEVWGPMLRGKFGSRAEDISMAWLWKKLVVRRQIKGEEARQELLGYPCGGWQPLLDKLQAEIEARGGRVWIDRPAARIETAAARGHRLHWGPPDSFRLGLDPRSFEVAGHREHDVVIATVPSDVFLELLADDVAVVVGDEYRNRVASINYHAALCLLIELDRQFTPFYWTNVADSELPFIGLIEQTNLIGPEHYSGRRFLYVANYLEPDDPLLGASLEDVLDTYEPGLRKVNPDFSRDWVRASWMFKEPHAQPIVDLGYGSRIPALRTPVDGLYLANTTQIYPEDRGTNYSVRLGDQVAELVLADLSAGALPPQTTNP